MHDMCIVGAERVSSLRVLGVLLNSKLTMTEHIYVIHSKHLLLLNVRVAPPTISRPPTTPGRQSNYSSLDTLRGAGVVVGIRRRGGPSSPGAPSRQDASKWIPATRLPGPCYSGRGC